MVAGAWGWYGFVSRPLVRVGDNDVSYNLMYTGKSDYYYWRSLLAELKRLDIIRYPYR